MTQELEARILSLAKSGVPSSHIARRLGIPRRDVNHVLKAKLKREQGER